MCRSQNTGQRKAVDADAINGDYYVYDKLTYNSPSPESNVCYS